MLFRTLVNGTLAWHDAVRGSCPRDAHLIPSVPGGGPGAERPTRCRTGTPTVRIPFTTTSSAQVAWNELVRSSCIGPPGIIGLNGGSACRSTFTPTTTSTEPV